jgi:hypothetical protein
VDGTTMNSDAEVVESEAVDMESLDDDGVTAYTEEETETADDTASEASTATVDAAPIASEEDVLESKRETAKVVYSEMPSEKKKAVDKWLGKRVFADLAEADIAEFYAQFE